MNRDEKRARARALPPVIVNVGKCRAIFPHEVSGGTWIAANNAGVCAALINWHRIKREPAGEIVSRGEVTKALAGRSCSADIADAIGALTLRKLRPFRLIAVVPLEQAVTEWRWNLEGLAARAHPWKAQHWFSSGFNEREAERIRAAVCAEFVAGGVDAGHAAHFKPTERDGHAAGVTAPGYNTLAALRRLHRSHAPEPGPFSICMHRADAVTVSYTEVAVSPKRLVMRYKNGAPCSARSTITKTLPLL